MARFGSKPPGEEVVSAIGPRSLRPTPHSSHQNIKSSVASRAAGFESPAAPKPPGLKPTLSFTEQSGLAAPKPPWAPYQKPTVTPKTPNEGLTPHKEVRPSYMKPSVGTKSLVSAFSAQGVEDKPVIPKPPVGLKGVMEAWDSQKENESRFPKPTPFNKPFNAVNSYEKPAFPKPSGLRPVLGEEKSPKPIFPKPAPKPGTDFVAGHKDSAEKGVNEEGGVGRFPLRPVKPVSSPGFKPAPFLSKPKAEETPAAPPGVWAKPKGQFPAKRQSVEDSEEGRGLDTPKRKPLPATWTLGPPPQKPNRPPAINLDKFKQQPDKQPPIPPASNRPANKQPPVPVPLVPSLPPRPQPSKAPDTIMPMDEDDENYDDVSPAVSLPPPLPPIKSEDRYKPSNSPDENEDSGGEMYEDLDSYRSRKDLKEMEKKREKDEKKRQEQERREQKEKEKKEQDIRKRFKMVGPIEVFQNVRASMDYKGGKNELTFKQGENLEVIRITDNPEGKWLARTLDGTYGYVKVTCVDIDYDDVKKKAICKPKDTRPQTEPDPEVYDDVAPNDNTGPADTGFFPPPPPIGDEIYDDVDNPPEDTKASSETQETSKAASWSWSLLKKKKGKEEKDGNRKARDKENSYNKGESNESSIQSGAPTGEFADGDDLYDDVGHDDFPPPPPDISASKLPKSAVRGKKDEKDPKKNKKFEKEEKEFRKKFKYDGEIKVLGVAEVAQTLANKKWSNKDLPLKGGEVLDIIQFTDNTKLLCRNDDGKFGYVQKVNLTAGNDDGDIYDDIDADCIYDND